MKTDLKNIQTYEQLKAARQDIKARAEVKRAEAIVSFKEFRHSLSPFVMVREATSRFMSSFDMTAIGTLASRAIRVRLEDLVSRWWSARKKQLVVFDLDGTIIDTIEDLGEAVNYALGLRNLPLHTFSEYKMMVGNGVRNLVKRALPEEYKEDEEYVAGMLKDFRTFYSEHILDHSKPYEGIVELLEWLDARGTKIAVASNKFHEGTDTLIRSLFPQISFSTIIGNTDNLPLKPDPTVLRIAMKEAGVSAANTFMVGDSATDIKTAANAGVKSIAVTWGFRPETELVEADVIVRSVSELKEQLK